MVHISVVIPVYGCKTTLLELFFRLKNSLVSITEDFEIILVNDKSPDNPWDTIVEISKLDQRVKGISLSRNFGQHKAITAGLDHTKGEWVVVMDCDLQDQPEELAKLYAKAQEGYDVVFGRRYNRHDSFLKRISSKTFYKAYNYLAESDFDSTIANYSICNRKVINSVISLREQSRSFPLFVKWVGYKIGYVDIEHAARKEGESAYTIRKLINFAIDSIISQSNRPLRLSIKIGLIFAFLSFIFGIYLIFKKLALGVPIEGWTSLMVSMFFIGGLILANLGFLGLYVGKIFDEVKDRPLYFIDEKVGSL
ncbi:MAG TPA: glycosyltransferase family 2 protein [Williamwhitmania sp.]|nr:glycosyltransferase family 2 protein [Williamwhitmania sp.]